MISDENRPFVTIDRAVAHNKHCVEVRHWDKVQDGYVVTRCSQPLNLEAAQSLARSWAAVMNLEIR